MQTFVELGAADAGEVAGFLSANGGAFHQASGWAAWQRAWDSSRESVRYGVRGSGGELVLYCQLLRMPLPLGFYYHYAPYGPVTSAAADAATIETFTGGLWSVLPASVFFRFEPRSTDIDWNRFGKKSKNIQPGRTLTLNITEGEDGLLAGMHPKCRYNVGLAGRHGVAVDSEFDPQPNHGLYAKEALDLIVGTAGRQGYRTFPRAYYERLLDFFLVRRQGGDVSVHLYKASYQNQLLAAAIVVDYAGTRTYLFGGSSSEHRSVMAPYLLHWRMVLDAKASGLKTYDFGGLETASGTEEGFTRFKRGFGGSEAVFAGAYDVVARPAHYRAYGWLRAINRSLNR